MPRGQRTIQGKLIQHDSGVWIREGTCDIYTPGQIKQYSALDIDGKVVLDIGGHIGCFAKYALDKGASYCVSVEPFPDNCDLYMKNLKHYDDCTLVEGAVVSSYCEDEELTLYFSTTDTSAHSLTNIRGRGTITVQTIQLLDLLKYKKPHILKIDAEGAEYDIIKDLNLILDMRIEQIAAELHLNLKDWRQQAIKFVEKLEKYYKPIVPAVIGEKNWNTTGVWRLR